MRNNSGQFLSLPVEPRIEARTHKTDTCWLWTGAKAGSGRYAVIRLNGISTRVSHLVIGSPRPSLKHYACHTCDNPSCVRPDHLFWGTASDNAIDMVLKGRNKEWTDEHRLKISNAAKELHKNPEFKKAHSDRTIARNKQRAKRFLINSQYLSIKEISDMFKIRLKKIYDSLYAGKTIEEIIYDKRAS